MILENIPRLFINDFKHRAPIVEKKDRDIIDIDYNLNNFGYRGDDFSKNTKMLVLGCSQTYGTGLPYEYTWASILAKKLNLSFANLAQPGESATLQIMKAFYYFERFGDPDIIVALFPIYRMPTVYVPNKMERKHMGVNKDIRGEKWKKMVESADLAGDKFENYSKAPHRPEEVLPKEMAFFYDNVMIDMLRRYCNKNGIKFVWSVWDGSYQDSIYPVINDFYPEHHDTYCLIEAFNWLIPNSKDQDFYGEKSALDCHNEFRSEELFYKAADRPKTDKDREHHTFSHWGLHKNIHIAEDFYNYITSSI